MSVMCFPGALSMWAKSCSGKDGHHSIAILPVLTEPPALCCHCGAVTQVTMHKSHHIVIFSPFLPNSKENVSHSEGGMSTWSNSAVHLPQALVPP